MFSLEYADEGARRAWLDLKRSAPVRWAEAARILSERPTTPSVRCFPFATDTLRAKEFKRKRYPQWVYVVSNSAQVYYLVDADRRIVFLRRVEYREFRGIMV